MSRSLRRVFSWRVGLVVAPVVVLAWVAWVRLVEPRVPLAAPHVETRVPLAAGEVSVLLAGDFAPADASLPLLKQHGYRYPYEATAPFFQGVDVAFANLESPVTDGVRPFWPPKEYKYEVASAAVSAWTWLDLDLVSLANNHVTDHGTRGLLDTLRHLDAAKIARVGGGADESEARRPVIFDVGGTRVGFLGYLEDGLVYDLYLRTFAVGGAAGCAKAGARDLEEDVRRLRPLVDVLVVSVHWGDNYAGIVPRQEALARRLAALGVDVVAGHHPHNEQPVEVLTSGGHRTVVLYSLGNYAWGAPGRSSLHVGLLARLGIEPRDGTRPGRLRDVTIVPIATQNRLVKYQPRPLTLDEHGWLTDFLAGSRARGTTIVDEGTQLRIDLR